jgi:hypothetical protein
MTPSPSAAVGGRFTEGALIVWECADCRRPLGATHWPDTIHGPSGHRCGPGPLVPVEVVPASSVEGLEKRVRVLEEALGAVLDTFDAGYLPPIPGEGASIKGRALAELHDLSARARAVLSVLGKENG